MLPREYAARTATCQGDHISGTDGQRRVMMHACIYSMVHMIRER